MTLGVRSVPGPYGWICPATFGCPTPSVSVFGGARYPPVPCDLHQNWMGSTTSRGYITSRRAGDIPFMSVYASSAWSGSDGDFSINVRTPARPYGWIWPGTIFWTGTTQQLRPDDQSSLWKSAKILRVLRWHRPANHRSVTWCGRTWTWPLRGLHSRHTWTFRFWSRRPHLSSHPVVDTPIKSLTPNNRSLSFLQSGSADRSQIHVPLSRGQFPVFPSEVTTFSTTSNRCH